MSFGFLAILDSDTRSELLKIVSLEKIIKNSNSVIIDINSTSKLLRVTNPVRWVPMNFLEATCGTGRKVLVPVPPQTMSIEEAQAWVQGNKTWIKPEVRT